jgi:hypothetical protein
MRLDYATHRIFVRDPAQVANHCRKSFPVSATFVCWLIRLDSSTVHATVPNAVLLGSLQLVELPLQILELLTCLCEFSLRSQALIIR